jgi:hypothetical protein
VAATALPEAGREAEAAGPDFAAAGTACADPGPDQDRIVAFVEAGCYRQWAHDPGLRSTGPLFIASDLSRHSEATHHRVIVYYSSAVEDWLRAGRPQTGIAAGAMIVKEMYRTEPGTPAGDKLIGWATMLKRPDESWDGWFWSLYFSEPGHMPPAGAFGYAACLTCHAMADNRESTFSSVLHLDGTVVERQVVKPLPETGWRAHPSVHDAEPAPREALAQAPALPSEDAAFAALFGGFLRAPQALAERRARYGQVVEDMEAEAARLPSATQSRALSGPHGPDTFLTSDQCGACHGGSGLFDPHIPKDFNMMVRDGGTLIDLSPYGEWSVSLMGLAGRDPVFHAQLESEKARRPEMRAFLDDTCYKCHGVMGLRQLHEDQAGRPFQHATIYAEPGEPNAKYGALARDGVSCTVCHHMAPNGLGTAETFTASFETGRADEVYGPFQGVLTRPMEQALGITPKAGEHIRSSELCGSCHTVVLPKLSLGKPYAGADPYSDSTVGLVHEQTTYLEWLNSGYARDPEGPETCQSCHMPSELDDDRPLSFRIANVLDNDFREIARAEGGFEVLNMLAPEQSSLEERSPFARHTLLGINLFVMEMFRQFGDVLGALPADAEGRADMIARMAFAAAEADRLAKSQTAEVDIVEARRSGEDLVVRIGITSRVGHKLPSGVGFRRAFLRVRVLDRAAAVLWASGETSKLGVILDGATGEPLASEFDRSAPEPHHVRITRQDQAQIYEERHANDLGQLTTSFLGLIHPIKDNRILPKGWRSLEGEAGTGVAVLDAAREDMIAHGTDADADYHADAARGADTIEYAIPLAAIPGAATVEADLFYQTIPPYYLRDVFELAKGPEGQRLFYIASRLDIAGTPIENWRLRIDGAKATLD